MSAREIAILTLDSAPCRAVLTRVAGLPFGKKILNKFSQTRGVFATFEEGWSVARKARPAGGHEHPSEIAVHLRFSKALRPSDYAVLYWLSKISAGALRIFDFGGNVGNLYYSYSTYLESTRSLQWTVFDLPSVIKEGERIATERGATGLRFTTKTQDAANCNVLLVSGALHYWEGSIQTFLEQFRQQPDHVIVNRTPVHDEQPSFITVQRTAECAFPCIVRNVAGMVETFAVNGYTMVDRWPAIERSLRMPLFPARTVPSYSGFYFRREEAKAEVPSPARQAA
jgi:putative methyltransferase (TIGR04325 family)